MSLGKGLESLIPPQNDGGEGAERLAQDPPYPPAHLAGHHEHDEDAGPAILSFDFADDPVASPAAVAYGAARETALEKDEKRQTREEAPPRLPAEAPFDFRAKGGDHIFHIETSKIRPNPNQPRRNFNEEGLRELAKSIREFGLLQPLIISRREVETASGVGVEYELIAGERRLLAAKILGLEYVPAVVRNVGLEREKLELSIIENLQREDLNPIEKARAFQRLQEEFRMTQREIAAKLGKSRETIANTVRLLDLPMYIQEALEKGSISESHGRFILAINDQAAQKKLFEDILAHNLTTRDLKQRVRRAKPEEERRGGNENPEIKMFEEKLTAELGTPVKIERGANTGRHGQASPGAGKITITFYSDEELQQIVNRFAGDDKEVY